MSVVRSGKAGRVVPAISYPKFGNAKAGTPLTQAHRIIGLGLRLKAFGPGGDSGFMRLSSVAELNRGRIQARLYRPAVSLTNRNRQFSGSECKKRPACAVSLTQHTEVRRMQMVAHETHNGGIHRFKEIGIHDGPRIEENLLLQEITHRINNELTSTIGIVALTAAQSGNEEVKIALAGVIQHIHDFASVHRALQMPKDDCLVDAATYLRNLCQSISRAKLQYRDIELLFRESPLQLSAKRCWRMGMIVSELIANASRHAFCNEGGRIQVELANRGALVQCTVTDNGSAREKIQPGQGLKIVRALAGDLNGSVDHRFGPRGTIVLLSFPLVETEPDGVDPGPLGFGHIAPR